MKLENQFSQIVELIRLSKINAYKAANVELINIYWQVGEYISNSIKKARWGDKSVSQLADYIQKKHPDIKGFNKRALYKMKQFYETYYAMSIVPSSMAQLQLVDNHNTTILPSLMAQLELSDIRNSIMVKASWTHHLILISRPKSNEERAFYLQLCVQENYTVKELERQINSSVFERAMIGHQKLPEILKDFKRGINTQFKDNYVFEFLDLPQEYNERELQKALISQMKDFVVELGKDYLFVGEEYPIQVGNSNFAVDLLFYHRGLQCLVAFELKTDKFKPEYLGKLNFYLEALDRDVKKDHEKPSIGVLLCPDQDSAVVQYALNRSISPTLASQYQFQFPDKKLLIRKFNEILNKTNQS